MLLTDMTTLRLIKIYLVTLIAWHTPIFAEPQPFTGIVALHNQVRASYGQQPLSWSDDLAHYAKQWTNYLATQKNCSMLHRPNEAASPFRQIYGENLFWASPMTHANGAIQQQAITSQDVVTAWAEEAAYYDYQTNQCQPGEDCGHFTQMVWHESRQMGCAMAICPDKSQIWACNYYPRGNYIGEWPY